MTKSFTGDIHKKHSFACACGQTHTNPIGETVIRPGALSELPAVVERLGLNKKLVVVTDAMVNDIVGKRIVEEWRQAGLSVETVVFPLPLIPDERALGVILVALERGCGAVVGLGGGSITDLTRYVGTKMGVPQISCPTAITHDGFFTDMALLIVGGMKSTLPGDPPTAVLADMDVIKNAPVRMNAAGLGEMSAKQTALCDWYAASLIRGEHYCEETEALMKEAIAEAFESSAGVRRGDPEALNKLADALYKSAVDMYWYGSARTGAGAEHHLTHYWVMRHNARGEKPNLHGAEAGVGSVLVCDLWARLLAIDETTFDVEAAVAKMPTKEEWEERVKQGYGEAAPEAFKAQKNKSFSKEERRQEVQAILAALPKCREKFAGFLPNYKELAQKLREAGAPYAPCQLHVTREELMDSVRYAKEVRSKYTSLWIVDALGLLEEFAQALADDAEALYSELGE